VALSWQGGQFRYLGGCRYAPRIVECATLLVEVILSE